MLHPGYYGFTGGYVFNLSQPEIDAMHNGPDIWMG